MTKRSDGRYQKYHDGKYFYGKTQNEVNQKIRAYDLSKSQGRRESLTVEAYAQRWLPITKPGVTTRTYNQYASCLDKLLAVCGNKDIRDVVQSDIKTVYASVSDMSSSMIHKVKLIILDLFDSAVADKIISDNPARGVAAPSGTAGSHRTITDFERHKIHVTAHRLRPMVMTMLYAGLRRGEALAINIDRDIDFSRNEIYISEAIRYESNQPIVSDPKTLAGRRVVPLLPDLRKELIGKHGWLAPSASGQLMSESAFTRAWSSYLHVTGLNIRCHDLRHSFCTMCRDSGVDMHVCIKWMGHSDERMIMRIYDHVSDDRVQDSVNKIVSKIMSKSQSLSETIEA